MIVRDKSELKIFQQMQPISEFKKNADDLKQKIEADNSERILAHEKQGITKKLVEEIIPLAYFAEQYFTNKEQIQYCYGSQQYDAKLFDVDGDFLNYIEITEPHLGYIDSQRNKDLVSQCKSNGYGMVDCSDDFDISRLKTSFEEKAKKKSEIEYEKCILIFVLSYPTFNNPMPTEIDDVQAIKDIIKSHNYHANKVYLYEWRIGSENKISQIK